ncbi:unnamed protein product [Parnassius apollo]|uniref:(apollo) hypothetical protein n=1 Tax=Parnassius apollo TaxID=110799 RepID=A0A8S3XXD1_PARAO|nr:unnamed protein product [Parnassius apollo]
MILPIALILNSFVMLTLAEPHSSDKEQLRLTPKNGEVLLTPVRFPVIETDTLTSGKTSENMSRTEALNGDPDIIFSGVPQFKKVMEMLLRDIQRGNHLLLVDDRGLENKKIVDRLLHQLNHPTLYTKLHRDATEQSLIVHPTVKNGTVIYEDSQLVKAVKHGYVLVVDEADQAPTTVTSSLNSLMENGEMVLTDGRRMSSKKIMNRYGGKPSGIIPVHEDFRMIIMASQTGFPFLELESPAFLAGLEDRGLLNFSSPAHPENRSNRRRLVPSLTSSEMGIVAKAGSSNPALTTLVTSGHPTGPYSATAIASGSAVATATALTYGTGTSTATAIADGSSVATATARSYDAGVATATADTHDSSSAEATAHAYDKGIATAIANAFGLKVVKAKAIAKGTEVITDTQTRPLI